MQSNILDDIPTRLLSLTAESSLSRIHTQHSLPVAENQVTLAVRLPSVMRSLSGASSVKKSALLNYSESDTFLMNYITNRESAYPNRINIPIADEDANVTFYTISREV